MSSERQENNPDNPWWGEHLHRYHEALKLATPAARVLDIACGSGFGSLILAQHGFRVTGADLSEETVAACRRNFSHPELRFEAADASALPYTNESFDMIVSFETIEHSTRYREMLTEFRRVLSKDGLLVLSTPNIVINSPGRIVRNPFHTQEWDYPELKTLLESVFGNVQLFGQQYSRYKHRQGLRTSLSVMAETLLYQRGIRKLPLSFKDRVMQQLAGQPHYPTAQDYELVSSLPEIITCKTFVALCKAR